MILFWQHNECTHGRFVALTLAASARCSPCRVYLDRCVRISELSTATQRSSFTQEGTRVRPAILLDILLHNCARNYPEVDRKDASCRPEVELDTYDGKILFFFLFKMFILPFFGEIFPAPREKCLVWLYSYTEIITENYDRENDFFKFCYNVSDNDLTCMLLRWFSCWNNQKYGRHSKSGSETYLLVAPIQEC